MNLYISRKTLAARKVHSVRMEATTEQTEYKVTRSRSHGGRWNIDMTNLTCVSSSTKEYKAFQFSKAAKNKDVFVHSRFPLRKSNNTQGWNPYDFCDENGLTNEGVKRSRETFKEYMKTLREELKEFKSELKTTQKKLSKSKKSLNVTSKQTKIMDEEINEEDLHRKRQVAKTQKYCDRLEKKKIHLIKKLRNFNKSIRSGGNLEQEINELETIRTSIDESSKLELAKIDELGRRVVAELSLNIKQYRTLQFELYSSHAQLKKQNQKLKKLHPEKASQYDQLLAMQIKEKEIQNKIEKTVKILHELSLIICPQKELRKLDRLDKKYRKRMPFKERAALRKCALDHFQSLSSQQVFKAYRDGELTFNKHQNVEKYPVGWPLFGVFEPPNQMETEVLLAKLWEGRIQYLAAGETLTDSFSTALAGNWLKSLSKHENPIVILSMGYSDFSDSSTRKEQFKSPVPLDRLISFQLKGNEFEEGGKTLFKIEVEFRYFDESGNVMSQLETGQKDPVAIQLARPTTPTAESEIQEGDGKKEFQDRLQQAVSLECRVNANKKDVVVEEEGEESFGFPEPVDEDEEEDFGFPDEAERIKKAELAKLEFDRSASLFVISLEHGRITSIELSESIEKMRRLIENIAEIEEDPKRKASLEVYSNIVNVVSIPRPALTDENIDELSALISSLKRQYPRTKFHKIESWMSFARVRIYINRVVGLIHDQPQLYEVEPKKVNKEQHQHIEKIKKEFGEALELKNRILANQGMSSSIHRLMGQETSPYSLEDSVLLLQIEDWLGGSEKNNPKKPFYKKPPIFSGFGDRRFLTEKELNV